jgi:hypothetical protein
MEVCGTLRRLFGIWTTTSKSHVTSEGAELNLISQVQTGRRSPSRTTILPGHSSPSVVMAADHDSH